VPKGMIAIVMPRAHTQDLEHISVHVMRVSTEMESLAQVFQETSIYFAFSNFTFKGFGVYTLQ
jgi:hypothetical protein